MRKFNSGDFILGKLKGTIHLIIKANITNSSYTYIVLYAPTMPDLIGNVFTSNFGIMESNFDKI